MTQRERARKAVERLYANPVDEEALARLTSALEDAQNGPPDGLADRSIGEDLWNALRRLEGAFFEVQCADRAIRRMV